jgi:hypothetical protein
VEGTRLAVVELQFSGGRNPRIIAAVHTIVIVPVEDDLGWMLDGFLNVHFFGWISVSIGSICDHFGDLLTPINETFRWISVSIGSISYLFSADF